jgi:hypothetical protein
LLYLVTLGLPSLHLVLEAHAICAEHGELTHVEGATVSPPTHAADDAAIDARPADVAHGHCDLPQLSTAVVVESHVLSVESLLSPEVRDSVAPSFAPRIVRALSFAPKTSPPSC